MIEANDAKLLKEITPYLSLTNLAMLNGDFYRKETLPPTGKVKLKVNFDGSVNPSEAPSLVCMVHFHLQGREGRRVVVKVEGEFMVRYAFRDKSKEDFTPEHLDVAARLNAPYNAWPYWREFVSTATNRMAVPSITLPLYRLMV